MAKNTHKVPKKQWRKWKNVGQATFNRLWFQIGLLGKVLTNPRLTAWRWNICWLAADVADGIEKDRIAGCFTGDRR